MKRILIVEDEALMRESLRRALHVLGYSVETVVDGVGGLETIVSDPPDVVLLDLMLGDEAFNGMEHWTSDTLNIDFSQILPQMEKASQNLPCATCQTLTALT